MSIHNITQDVEIRFWNLLINMMAEEGPISKLVKFIKGFMDSRIGSLALLIVVWASVGFIAGLIIGKIVALIQVF